MGGKKQAVRKGKAAQKRNIDRNRTTGCEGSNDEGKTDERSVEPSGSKRGKSGIKAQKGSQKSPRLVKGGVVARIKSGGAAVTFKEDGNLVDMEAEGMDSEFMSDENDSALDDMDKQKGKEGKSGKDGRESKAAKGNGRKSRKDKFENEQGTSERTQLQQSGIWRMQSKRHSFEVKDVNTRST